MAMSSNSIFSIARNPENHAKCEIIHWKAGCKGGIGDTGTVPLCDSNLSDSAKETQICGDKDVTVVRRESGSMSHNLPIWAARPNLINMDSSRLPVTKEDVLPTDGLCFLLRNVLSSRECQRMISVAETMGFTPDAPVSLSRDVRHNDNCVWVADQETLNNVIFERCRHLLPEYVEIPVDVENCDPGLGPKNSDLSFYRRVAGPVAGINQRWRLYRYHKGDEFKAHFDGGWAGTGLSQDGKKVVDDLYNGKQFSFLTFLIYLNQGASGGSTKFYLPATPSDRSELPLKIVHVEPEAGSVLCFWHGDHPRSPVHEAEKITDGVKYVVRTDVLYELGGKGIVVRDNEGALVQREL